MSGKIWAGKTRGQIEAETREKENRAVELRRNNVDYTGIAAELGYASESGARQAVDRALRRHEEPNVDALRRLDNAKLDDLERIVRQELARDDLFLVQFGKIVYNPIPDDEGKLHPLRDSETVLRCVRELRMITERRAKLWGLDAPLRVVVDEITPELVQTEMARINEMAERLEREMGLDP